MPMKNKPIPLFHLIMEPLYCLRDAFTRHNCFLWFCTAVLAVLFGYRRYGTIQDDLNTLVIGEEHYHSFLHFFNSDALKLPKLVKLWRLTVKEKCSFYKKNNRCVIVGDSTKSSKEGRRMIGVKRLHSNSATQSKSSSFHGIHAGALVVLVKGIVTPSEIHSFPLEISIMEGLGPIADWENTPKPYAKESVEMQELRRLEEILKDYGDCYYVTDRASMAQGLFSYIEKIRINTKQQVDMITNAKSDCTCYPFPEYCGKGRKPIRGKAFKIYSLFETKKKEFKHSTEYLYGKMEEISYYAEIFLWGREWNGPLLFVLCHSSKGYIVLACTDLSMEPLDEIRLYALRFGTIEEDFKSYKNDLTGMGFRFWSMVHPHLSHFRKATEGHILEEITTSQEQQMLLQLLKREESYMQIVFIAFGILKYIAMHQPVGGYVQKTKVKRTYTKNRVSTLDVQYYLSLYKTELLKKYRKHEVVEHIMERQASRRVHKYL